MSEVFDYMESIVDEARQHTDTTIANVSASLLPYFVDLRYNIVRTNRYRYDNETVIDDSHMIIKVEGIRTKSTPGNFKREAIFRMNVWEAVIQDKIFPFVMFLDGKHVKWSDITIVKDTRYTYLLIPKNPFKDRKTVITKIKSIKCLYIPFNVKYTETREKCPKNYTEFLRFSIDGDLVDSGKVVYYVNHPKFVCNEYSFADGAIRAYDLEISHDYRLTENNFLIFKNKQLITDEEMMVNRLNLFYLNGTSDKYKVKCFYRTDVNVPYNTINKFPNVGMAKEIAQQDRENGNVDSKILNTDFDFTSDVNKGYDLNVRTNFKYVSSYDTDFISHIYEKINTVETKTYTGKEIREKVDLFGVLHMLLLKYKKKETKVIVFCNGVIYKRYSDLKYSFNEFTLPVDMNELRDSDVFEFVFIKNINNYSELIHYTRDNRFKTQNPFEDDELLLYTRNPQNHKFKDKIKLNDRSWFNVDFEIDEDGNVVIDEAYEDTDIMYTTKNQFRYTFRVMQKENVKIRLSEEFMICLNPNQYIVFINGRLLNREFYRLILPTRNNVFTEPYLYSRVKLHPGDKIEVFYLPTEFKDMNYAGNLITNLVDVVADNDAQLAFVIPYPFKLYTFRDDFVVFKDSVYVDPSRYKTKNGILTFTDGTYVNRGDKLTFLFIYDSCSEQEASIYINDANGVYMEHIYLQVVADGQTRFDLGEDKYIDYLMEGNSIMVFYHGMYVPSEYWSVNKYTGILTFAPNSFKRNDYLTVELYHISDKMKTASTTTTSKYTWTSSITTDDLAGFPIMYTDGAKLQEIMNFGKTNFVNKCIDFAKSLIANKNSLIGTSGSTTGSSTSVEIAGFPMVYADTMRTMQVISLGKEVFVKKCIEFGKSLIGSKRTVTTTSYGNSSSGVNVFETSNNGITKTETKLIAQYDNQTEFSGSEITGFPISAYSTKTFADVSGYTTNELLRQSESIIDEALSKMDSLYFDIGEYIAEGKPIFIMRNNVLLHEGTHYIILREANRIKFTEPLYKGEEVYLITFTSEGRTIKTYEHDITIKDVTQREYDLFDEFGSLDRSKCRFIIYLGSLVLDHRRYEMDKDCKLTFSDDVVFEQGQHVRIITLFIDENTKSMYTYNYLGSSKYHSISHAELALDKDVDTYAVPYPDEEKEAGFIVFCGGILLDNTRYVYDDTAKTIRLTNMKDPMFTENTALKFVFMYDDMKTLTVETGITEEITNKRYTYEIPVPFPNYFLCGNNILVFRGGTLVDPESYTIDEEANTLTLIDTHGIEDKFTRFVFIYHKANQNIAYDDEDMSISSIRQNGYVFFNKDMLEHPLSKSLFWMFINGKKVSLNDITDISANLVKVNRDQQSRYNLVLMSHTPKIDELDSFFKTYSNYDTLINNLEVEDLGQLFNEYRQLSDTEPHYDMDVSREAIVTEIMRDWYGRTGIYDGASFKNTYQDISGVSDVQIDTDTREHHSMVLDGSKFFSARLKRDDTNSIKPQR